MTESCVFCAILAGRLPAEEVLRTDEVIAFLDRRPVFHGHVLVVPTRHVETLADLPTAELGPYFAVVQDLAGAVERGMDADGTWVSINNRVSQSVPHLHVHVVPRRRKDGLRGFYWPRQEYADAAEAAAVAERIRAAR
jgi:histidine triad (HIT) family protein